jgi:hypothetical protein
VSPVAYAIFYFKSKINMDLNYIKLQHLFFDRARNDPSLTAYHQSMYMHLFLQWNRQHFDPRLKIKRDEIMAVAGIGSKSTYYNCLKDLNRAGYIRYTPGKRLAIKMMLLDEKPDSTISGTITTTDSTISGTTDVPLMGQIIASDKKSVLNQGQPFIINKTVVKNVVNSINTCCIPSLDEVIVFFDSQKYTREEARIFWTHFEKKGWKSGDKPIQNWKGMAKKYVIDHRNKKPENEQQRPKKNYHES